MMAETSNGRSELRATGSGRLEPCEEEKVLTELYLHPEYVEPYPNLS